MLLHFTFSLFLFLDMSCLGILNLGAMSTLLPIARLACHDWSLREWLITCWTERTALLHFCYESPIVNAILCTMNHAFTITTALLGTV